MSLKDRVEEVNNVLQKFLVDPPVARFEDGVIRVDAFSIGDEEITRKRIGREVKVPGYRLDVMVWESGHGDVPDFDSLQELEISANFDAVVRTLIVKLLDDRISNYMQAEGMAAQFAEEQRMAPEIDAYMKSLRTN